MKSPHRCSSSYRCTLPQLAALMVFAINMIVGVGTVRAAPIPGVQALGDQSLFLGDQASFHFDFSNTGLDPAYSPFIELALDTSGPDGASSGPFDGYATPTMTVAGLNLIPVASIPVSGTTFVNPLTGETRPVPTGFGVNDTIFIYALPFGSFTPGQTTLATVTVSTSNLADLGTALPIAVTPGFRDDEPSLNGPAFYGSSATGSITPILYTLNKRYLGPDDEGATGPNYPQRYRLEVDVATGQTVTNLVVTDDLATSMQIIGRDAIHMFASTAAGGLGSNSFVVANSGGTAVTTAPDGTLTYSFGSVTGVDGIDAVFEFEFYVPRDTSAGTQVLPQNATSGTDSVLATNSSNSSADWTPVDVRDIAQAAVPPAALLSTLTHALEDHGLAIQKIAEPIDPTTGNAAPLIIPGTTLVRYTLQIQVSDYYALQNIKVNDTLADGMRLFTGTRGSVNAGIPTLSVTNAYLTGSPNGSRTNVVAAPFDSGTIGYERHYTTGNALSDPTSFPVTGPTASAFTSASSAPPTDGGTLLTFDISSELVRRLGANAGRLVGGEINNNGTGPDNDPFAGPKLGATTAMIVFYAEVTQEFSDDFPSQDASIDQGDLLNNYVENRYSPGRDGIFADEIMPAEINAPTPTLIGKATDDSHTETEIPYGDISKTINRINGDPVPTQTFNSPPFTIQPTDRITYKLTYTLPINSYEQLILRDYPPLPVMAVGTASNYHFDGTSPTYSAYSVAIAPDDTFFSENSFVAPSVNLATTSALMGATYSTTGNGSFSFAAAPIIDDVAVVAADRILVKNQADARQNGLYVATTATSWVRATDMDAILEVADTRMYAATAGTINTNVYYVQTNNQFSSFNSGTSSNPDSNLVFAPFISTTSANNEIALNFGNFSDPTHQSVSLSVLLTLPVGDQVFSGELLLTNQLRINEASTNNGTTTVEDLRRFELTWPKLSLYKGVVGTNTTGFILGGITFTAPTTTANFSAGPIDTSAEADAIGAKGLTLTDSLDASDKVRYAIVAQNTDKGDAFDVILSDTIPAEYNRATFNPATDLVLRHGDATLLNPGSDYTVSYTAATGALQIQLNDNYTAGNINSPVEDNRSGAMSRGMRVDQTNGDVAITNGSNTIIAMYDVVLQASTPPNQTIINTASITNYSNNNGGPGFLSPKPTDSAQVITKLPTMVKTLVSTEVGSTGNNSTGGAGAQATIGEYVTFQLTLTVPEGVSSNALLVDTLDAGLAFVDVTAVTASPALSYANGGLPSVSATPANTTIAAFGGQTGRQMSFDLGSITNSNTDNSVAETISISYRAIVLNTLANQSAQTRNNAVQLTWDANPATVAPVAAGQSTTTLGMPTGTATPVSIVEPTLTNLKDVRNATQSETFPVAAGTPQQTRGDAGDTIEYRITINNPTNGSTTAYDVSLSDPLPTTFFTGGFTVNSASSTGTIRFNGTARAATAADFIVTAGTLQLVAGLDVDIDPGATITILVQGAGFTGVTGQLVDNIADLRWSSLDGPSGTRSTYNSAGVERTGTDGEIGSGTLNDYRDTDNAIIESPPIVRKTVVATSEAHTTGSNATIGEIVRFRMVASVAEGISRNYQVQDFLPAGMSFLNDGTARWALVSTGGNVVASTAIGSVPSLGAIINTTSGGFNGNQASLATITSADIIGTFSDANISTDANGTGMGDAAVYADGAAAFFRFGTLTNSDNDADVEYVIVEFNALVGNVLSNQSTNPTLANRMTILADTDNNGTAGYIDIVNDSNGDGVGAGEATITASDSSNNGSGSAAQSAPVSVTVVEPNLTINKEVRVTTGSIVTYRITLTNPAATNASTGYNLRVSDTLPAADLTLRTPGSLTAILAGGATGATNNSSGNSIDFTIDVLPVGSSVIIEYSADVLTTPIGTTSTNNTANATDTSLAGITGTGGSWTGTASTSSAVPGAAGSATGERTGQDGAGSGLNNYAVSDTERLGSVGDRVFYDANANGIQDAGEPGLVGVPVTITWAGPDNNFATTGDNSVIMVNTGANGIWTVAGLPLGSTQRYRVSVPTIFSGMSITDVRDNGGAVNTNPDGIGIGISAITLTGTNAGNTNNRIQDFGYRGTASLGNHIYIDADGDGIQDTNGLEPSLPGVTTTLLWAGPDNDFAGAVDNLTFTQNSSNAATNYLYSNLPAGEFKITASATAGTGGVPDNMTLTDVLDNGGAVNTDPNGQGAGIVLTTLTVGENELTIDYGYKGTASIGDYVWYDVDGDGVQDAGEPPIAGASVTLLWSGPDGSLTTAADNVTFTTTSDANGLYLFPSLPVNGATDPYSVTVNPGTAYPTQTYDADGLGTANNSTYNLAPTENNATQDFGYRGTAQLGNLVWEDLNGNGRQDAGDPGINGVTVELYFDRNGDGDFADAGENTPLLSTITTGGGLYSFTDLPYGNYQVVFGNGNGTTTYNRTVIDSAVASDVTDSDANVTTGRTGTYTLSSANANNQSVDAGLMRLISLGDRVYYDYDNNGIKDTNEPGIPNATVTVTWLGPDSVVGGGDDVTYTGVTMDSNGNWSLGNLPPGSFQITVTNLPANLTNTDSLDETGGAASPANPVAISTTSGVNRSDIDFGFRGNGSIGDHVFLDLNNNGTFDIAEGIAAVTVTLNGDLNGDGIDETLTTTTDADGFYQFTHLRTNATGVNYTITIDTSDLPQDGTGNPLPNTVDPDTANPGDNTSSVSLTTAVSSNQAQDFGYRGLGQIGDTIFLDTNGDNQPSAGEGITGVMVTLSGDLDGDGTAETFTTTTNVNGVYDFSYLPVRTPGGTLISYTVSVDTTTLPAAVTNTVDPDTANPGNNTSSLTLPTSATPIDLDQDFGYRGTGSIGDRVFLDIDNGSDYDLGEGIANMTVTLTADLNGDGMAETFTTITDADGFYQFSNLPIFQKDGITPVSYIVKVVTSTLPAGVSNTTDPDGAFDSTSALTLDTLANNLDQDFGYRGTSSLGDRVWIDADSDGVQDAVALEPGLPGISMQLTWAGLNGTFGDADDVTSSVTTDSTGAYLFNSLPAGTYRVNVDSASLPTSLTQTYDLDGLGTANQAERILSLGEAAINVDFGYSSNASVGDRLWLDQDGDGVQDTTEAGLPGVTLVVTWYGNDGALGGDDDVIFTTTTGTNGIYLVNGLPANTLVGTEPNYRVEVTGGLISGLTLTDSLDNGAAPSPVNPVDIQVSPVDGNALNDRRDIDFGYDGASSLAGTVFRDDNNNGVQDAGEPGIGGVTLTLTGVDVLGNSYIDPSTGQPYVAITKGTGDYIFPTVVPGTYTIIESQPTNYNDGIDTAGSLGGNAGNDVISGIPMGADQIGLEYNFGEIGTFISGIVFRDDNQDGVLDATETTGLGGVTIQLYNSTGSTLIASTTTAADGSYRFDTIAMGNYRIVETQPADYASSPTGPFAPNTRTVIVPAAGLPNQNFGEILASISGVVYIDSNNDGTRNTTETGRVGTVAVILTGTDINGNARSVTVYSDPTGAYRFDNLFPADAAGYTITEGSAAPYTDRAANPGTGAGGAAGTASDANTITSIGLTVGSQAVNYDFGEIQATQPFIAGSVYRDDDKDGVRGTSELPIPGTTITLYDAGLDGIFGNGDDGPAQTVTTDANGYYLFTEVISGRNYQIIETQPAIYGNSPVGPTTLITVSALPATGSSNNNFGELLGSLAGLVYFDANNNGAFDTGEAGIPGVTVTLIGTDLNDNLVSLTSTTVADGSYMFEKLPAGNYTVVETQPVAYADGSETVGTAGGLTSANDTISAIPLSAGQNATSYNFGELGIPVSGTVFYDKNRDGELDAGDTARIGGVSIQLVDSNGIVVATTTTAADGSYLFPNVAPGSYTLVEVQPAGYGDPLGGTFAPNTRPITVANTAITNQNFGDTLSTLAGSVYGDMNDNGIREGSEIGISGVTVRLDWAGLDGVFGTGDDVTGFDSSTTGNNGGYLFTNLPTGVYSVVEPAQPTPYSDGRETAGLDGGNTSMNEQISDVPVAAGVDLIDYNFGELPPPSAFISGSVYVDSNNNGTRDAGEPGITGVSVTLSGPGAPVSITTDANGNYVFPNLTSGASYTVTESQPTTYGNGQENPGNTISIPKLPVIGSSNNNFGELPGSIRGTVYFDADQSGTLTAGDTLIPGIRLTLQDGNGAPVNNPLTGQPYVVTTAADGSYNFENLPAADYRVIETQPASYNDGAENPGAGNTSTVNDRIDVPLAAGATSTDNNYGELGTSISGIVWVDGNHNGMIDSAEADRLGGVTINLFDSNGTLVATTTTSADGSYSFGNLKTGNYTIVQVQPNAYGSSTPNTIAISLPVTGMSNQNFGEILGSLVGMVYADVNRNGNHDAGEPGIPGVPVALSGTDINGNAVTRTATTDASGSYSFGDLPAGNYQVIETQPTTYNDGQEQVGSAGGTIPSNDTITNVPLGAGVNASDYNFGEVSASISGTVWLDRNRDGVIATGEPGIGSVIVELRNSKGDLIATMTSNPDGSYSFIGLPGGDYQIIELQPNGYGSSTSNTISVSVPNDALITNQDFGDILASISGAVYIDANNDGVRDPGEVGIPGVTVSLTGDTVNGDQVTRTVTTDSNGNYTFGDLLAGSYTVIESQPANYGDGLDAIGSAGGSLSNDTAGSIGITSGLDANGYNFGEGIPTAIVLAHFSASHEEAGVMLRWVTSGELNTWGFQLYRSTSAQRENAMLVTPTLIVAKGYGQGAQYEWLDRSAEADVTYTYWLVETELDGRINQYSPVQTTLTTPAARDYHVLLPLVMR